MNSSISGGEVLTDEQIDAMFRRAAGGVRGHIGPRDWFSLGARAALQASPVVPPSCPDCGFVLDPKVNPSFYAAPLPFVTSGAAGPSTVGAEAPPFRRRTHEHV